MTERGGEGGCGEEEYLFHPYIIANGLFHHQMCNGYLLLLITVGHIWDIRNQIKNQNSSTQLEFWFQLIRNSNDFSNSGSG